MTSSSDMGDAPRWVDRILEVLRGHIECYRPGTVEVRYDSQHSHLVLAPVARTRDSKGTHGDLPFPSLQLRELSQPFDSVLEIWWGGVHHGLHVKGRIRDESARITFQKFSFPSTAEEHAGSRVILTSCSHL